MTKVVEHPSDLRLQALIRWPALFLDTRLEQSSAYPASFERATDERLTHDRLSCPSRIIGQCSCVLNL